MSTSEQQNTKMLSFRVPRELWLRLNDVKVRKNSSIEALGNAALVKYLDEIEHLDVNGKSVRSFQKQGDVKK